jgi:hypothetical protein
MAFNAETQRRKDAKSRRCLFASFFAPLRLCVFASIQFVIVAGIGFADDKPPPKSLDAQLLEGLDADLLKGLPAPSKRPAGDQPAADKPTNPTDPAGALPESTASNPLAQIAERMRAAQQRIAGRDTSDSTQQLQRQIQDDLAALIEQAKQQCAACNKSGSGQGQLAGTTGGNPTPAAPRDSTGRIEQGTKEEVETADVQDLIRRFWGHLPDKMREQMQSSLSEQFLPKYERLIEDYYRRLAEDPRARP